ncbi:DUF86 domain-containing protein [Demequina sp. NBRC 110057]|uniref:HepT-like ribonuclease domain-containing protein n=1 Tax=Demequina sp. NBRC 110057 TaxID=1570346 RepID=UPI0009FCF2F6|nr:HepT-like ribonuclease domain-containing protein [Demequina sp. NBRC 110057]
MSRSATERLGDALILIDTAIEYAARSALDDVTVDAISLRIASGIECLQKLPDAVRDAMFGDAWPDVWGMRNRIAHTSSTVQPDVVMATVTHDLPGIRSRIADELAERESAR